MPFDVSIFCRSPTLEQSNAAIVSAPDAGGGLDRLQRIYCKAFLGAVVETSTKFIYKI
jgi:hypothetical protein